jgi:DNA-binding HxlR family transcriptional regulator
MARSSLPIYPGPLRFSRLLERFEGVSYKSLTKTLHGLERDGLIRRTVTVKVPIRVDYEATPLGHKQIGNFQPFWAWSVGRVEDFTAARENLAMTFVNSLFSQALLAVRIAEDPLHSIEPNRNAVDDREHL